MTNNANGCTDDATIVVLQDTVAPIALAGVDVLINCYAPTGTLGSATNPSGAGYSLLWTTVGGHFTSPVNCLTAGIDQSGTYQLLITNTQNGCTDTDNVSICRATGGCWRDGRADVLTSIVLQGTGSLGGIYSYLWGTNGGNIVSGGTTLTPTINSDGDYTLLVTNTQNGCTFNDQVTITQSADVPLAVVAR